MGWDGARGWVRECSDAPREGVLLQANANGSKLLYVGAPTRGERGKQRQAGRQGRNITVACDGWRARDGDVGRERGRSYRGRDG